MTNIGPLQFPPEINVGIAKFLPLRDALNYQNSCKQLKNDVDLHLMENALPFTIDNQHWRGDYLTGDTRRVWLRLNPLLLPDIVHSVIFRCRFNDQNWGNRKGVVYISELQPDAVASDLGSVICTSHTAFHHSTDLCLAFKPKPGLIYALCYKVGGGGGHELFVNDAQVQSVIHGSTYATLMNQDLPISQPVVMDRLRAVLDTEINSDDVGQYNESVALFESVGLDLRHDQHVASARRVLQEYQRVRII
jgi:hypothetical protein